MKFTGSYSQVWFNVVPFQPPKKTKRLAEESYASIVPAPDGGAIAPVRSVHAHVVGYDVSPLVRPAMGITRSTDEYDWGDAPQCSVSSGAYARPAPVGGGR